MIRISRFLLTAAVALVWSSALHAQSSPEAILGKSGPDVCPVTPPTPGWGPHCVPGYATWEKLFTAKEDTPLIPNGSPLSPSLGGTGLTALGAGVQTALGIATNVPFGFLTLSAPTVVTASSYTLPGPGKYLINAVNCVVTLPALIAGSEVVVTDATMAANPNITISGYVNGDSGGVVINNAGGGVRLLAVPALSSWWVQ